MTLNIEDCMTKFELPKLDSYDDHFFVILTISTTCTKNWEYQKIVNYLYSLEKIF